MIAISIIAGLVTGMLINYLTDVLPERRKISLPVCQHCQETISLKDYLLFKHCANCGQPRKLRTYLVLALSAGAGVLLWFYPFGGFSFWGTLPLLIFLGVITVIDLEHRLVLKETSLAGIGVCLVYGIFLRGLIPTLVGGLTGFLIMFALFITGVVFSRVLGKLRNKTISEVAFGFGDVMAGTFLGLLTGWPGIAAASVAAMLLFGAFSLVYLISLIVSKRYRVFGNALPFVPFLVLGTVVLFYL